jgi:hypothetical protein
MKTSRNRIITAMIAATAGMASAPAFAIPDVLIDPRRFFLIQGYFLPRVPPVHPFFDGNEWFRSVSHAPRGFRQGIEWHGDHQPNVAE